MRRSATLVALLALSTTSCGGGTGSEVNVSPPVPSGATTAAECVRFINALPHALYTGVDRISTKPASPYVAAFGRASSPIVVRCGVGEPRGYTISASLVALNAGAGEVGWFEKDHGKDAVFTSVRRPTKAELSVPRNGYEVDVVLGSVGNALAKTTPPGTDGTD